MDLAGKRFVISGLSRLTVRVAGLLVGRGADVSVVGSNDQLGLAPTLERLGCSVVLGPDGEAALREAGVDRAGCLLALSDDDLANLDAAVLGHVLAPDVPVVLRSFHPALIDQLEERLNVRRAYSVTGLAAPAFVAAALQAEVVETLRLGEEEVPLCRFTVRAGSPTAGSTAAQLKADHGCAVLAVREPEGRWEPGSGERRIPPGGEVLVGGPLLRVLRLASLNGGPFGRRPGRARHARPPRAQAGRRALASLRGTFLPAAALVLTALLVLTILVFGVALELNPVEALYFAVSTALGNATLDQSQEWLKVLGVVSMVAGGALLGVVFSFLAAVATTQRLEQRMGRRAERLSGHAVVVGLGTVGYRVERLLFELGLRAAVLDRSPDTRFVDAVGERTPVLTGDVRLPENLERTGVARAACLFACTDDDLTNVEACMQARRINPEIRTVARIFDETLAERVHGLLGIDVAISATRVAASAFVGAAVEERATRPFAVDGLHYLAVRYDATDVVPPDRIEEWRASGIRILALRRGDGPVQPVTQLDGAIEPGDSVILAGPAAVTTRVLEGPGAAPPRR